MESKLKVGLVLTGGGSRAAYQVGVLEALAALPVEVVAVSGVGAGTLNGAVIAASATLSEGAAMLRHLWDETLLSEQSAIRVGPVPVLRLGTYLTLLFAGGVKPEIEEKLRGAAQTAQGLRARSRPAPPSIDGVDTIELVVALAGELVRVTTDAELDRFLSDRFRNAASTPLIPFYASVYQVDDGPLAKIRMGLELAGLVQQGAPRYVEVSSSDLSAEERINAVLASATLPFLCETGSVKGARFVDGSFGGMKRAPGAVPLQPLRRDERIKPDAIIVVHTESGVTWSASDYPNTPIIEIRPSKASENANVGYFWSDNVSLHRWIELGRSDSEAVFKKWLATTSSWQRGLNAHASLAAEAQDLDEGS